MEIKIGKYTNWFGPYQLAEALAFWVRPRPDESGLPSKPNWVHKFGEYLASGKIADEPKIGEVTSWNTKTEHCTWINRFLCWIETKKHRKVSIKIDKWDTWNMGNTLALIIVPMLKQLRDSKHGAPFVDDDDAPEPLKSTSAPTKENEWDTDENHFKRWDYVLGEMLFAFESQNNDWEDGFHSGEHDIRWLRLEDGCSQMITGENDTSKTDYDGMKLYQERINNGLRLFGKYYNSLWD